MSSIRNNLTLEDAHEVINIRDMLTRKGISLDAFKPVNGLKLGSDINKHASWAYKHIYKKNYVSGEKRWVHGILHVSRVAVYIPVLINLYQRYDIDNAYLISNEHMQLLQIAALFHDSGREDEGKDYWDHESGIILYLYLTRVLGTSKTTAQKIAEAVANKDHNQTTGVYSMEENTDSDNFTCNFIIDPLSMLPNKNISQMIIHDADCLDVIRARPFFKGKLLDIYKQLAKRHLTVQRLDELSQLIIEVRALVHLEGDSFFHPDSSIKEKYVNENAMQHILADLSREFTPILFSLSVDMMTPEAIEKMSLIDLTPYQHHGKLTPEFLLASMRRGKVFTRCIPMPNNLSRNDETLIDIDLRKCFRTIGIPTRSKKPNNLCKEGNPYRSTSPLCPGGSVFSSAGFFILNPDMEKLHHFASRDVGTGRGKKTELKLALAAKTPLTMEQKHAKYNKLIHKLKLGGNAISYTKTKGVHGNHAEAIYDISCYHAIFYTNDPTLNTYDIFRNPKLFHEYTSLIQAIHIHYAYQKRYDATLAEYINTWGKMSGKAKFHARFGESRSLPIFYYSGMQNILTLLHRDDISEDKIIFYWIKMCQHMLDESFKRNDYHSIINSSFESMKIFMVHGSQRRVQEHKPAAADSNYPEPLKARLNEALINVIRKKLAIHSAQHIKKFYAIDLRVHILDMISLVIYHPALFNDEQLLLIAHASLLMSDTAVAYLSETRNYSKTLFEFRKATLTENFHDILSILKDTSGLNIFDHRIQQYNKARLFQQLHAEAHTTLPALDYK